MTTSTTTTLVRLNNTPETSRVIGWLTSQERLAYNQAVNVLNREPIYQSGPRRAPATASTNASPAGERRNWRRGM